MRITVSELKQLLTRMNIASLMESRHILKGQEAGRDPIELQAFSSLFAFVEEAEKLGFGEESIEIEGPDLDPLGESKRWREGDYKAFFKKNPITHFHNANHHDGLIDKLIQEKPKKTKGKEKTTQKTSEKPSSPSSKEPKPLILHSRALQRKKESKRSERPVSPISPTSRLPSYEELYPEFKEGEVKADREVKHREIVDSKEAEYKDREATDREALEDEASEGPASIFAEMPSAFTPLERQKVMDSTRALVGLGGQEIFRSHELSEEEFKQLITELKSSFDERIQKALSGDPRWRRYQHLEAKIVSEALELKMAHEDGMVEEMKMSYEREQKQVKIELTSPPSDEAIAHMMEASHKLSPLYMQECGKGDVLIRFYEASLLSGVVIRFTEADQKLLLEDLRYAAIEKELKARGKEGFRTYVLSLSTEEHPRALGTLLPRSAESPKSAKSKRSPESKRRQDDKPEPEHPGSRKKPPIKLRK